MIYAIGMYDSIKYRVHIMASDNQRTLCGNYIIRNVTMDDRYVCRGCLAVERETRALGGAGGV